MNRPQADASPGKAGTHQAAAPNELIVSLPHLQLIRRELGALNIKTEDPAAEDRSRELGLARLPLHATDKTLDAVVAELRGRFQENYGNWVPPIGKNRFLGHVAVVGDVTFGYPGEVVGAGEVTFGGGGVPTPTLNQPAWPPRGAGPGQGARVGLADTKLAPQPWMAGGWTARYSDREPESGKPYVMAGHATFITGLVLSQAPGAIVEVRGILGDDGTAGSWEVAKKIVEFGRSGVDVLNLSFACYTVDGMPPLAMATAIDRLDSDTVVVAAAGNLATQLGRAEQAAGIPPAWPAALDDVVAVGAATRRGVRAAFSPDAPWVDLLAVGVEVRSTFFNCDVSLPRDPGGKQSAGSETFDGYAEWKGTSFAAALVSGAIAAGIEPGRVSARESLADILATLEDPRRVPRRAATKHSPPFLRLELPQ